MDVEPSSSSTTQHPQPVKKRRLHGACDICRKKKVKCDSAKMPQGICTNCIVNNHECTHLIPRHNVSEKKSQKGYIRVLEERLNKMERIISLSEHHSSASPSHHNDSPHEAPSPAREMSEPVSTPSAQEDISDQDDLAHTELSAHLDKLTFEQTENRFFGPASFFMFVKEASDVTNGQIDINASGRFRIHDYWNMQPWEREYAEQPEPDLTFPEQDLLYSLVSIYFTFINAMMPLLHRPSFERNIREGQHLVDKKFGKVVLAVCAVASRYSADSRVQLISSSTLVNKLSLYDLQQYCLAIHFFLSTSVPHGAWSLLGVALRYAQERGAHRRKGHLYKPTFEDELWKRAFWFCISVDRYMSSYLGRLCAIQDEDFDVEFPIECDDEYWDPSDPDRPFKQPPGKPSLITGFNCSLKLCEILAYMLRTLYSTKKSKVLRGLIGDQWEQRIVAELDSSMNNWKDSLPEHLRWDPNRPNSTFFNQSALLYATFYYIQIQIHRPFLLRKSPLSLPSFAICTSAARSCSHLLAAVTEKQIFSFPSIFMSAFASGVIICMNMSRLGRDNRDREANAADLNKCIDFLREYEKRSQTAGRLRDLLQDLSGARDGPIHRTEGLLQGPDDPTKQKLDMSGHVPNEAPYSHPYMGYNPPSNFSKQDNFPAQYYPTTTAGDPVFSAGNNWDLSNFLLSQMGYMGGTSIDLPPSQVPPVTEEMFPDGYMSSWSEAPAAFNIEEWHSYITSIGQNEG